ncbi:MAG: cobalamin-binding protein [Planctomycetota bacterium]|nr:cobalamin-binding protein [Planctomycetota bacterium]
MTKRIISLIASSTEILCALGFEDQLVGRSHECDYPESVKQLPIVTEPRFEIEGSSAEIDTRVKETLKASPEDALSVYKVHKDRLKALAPDLIVTQSQCAVCAVSLSEVERAVCEVLDGSTEIVSCEPHCLDDIWTDIRRIAGALNVSDKAEALIEGLKARLARMGEEAQKLTVKPTVATIEWIEPLMTGGNWVPELVRIAGGANLFGEEGKHSPWLSWEQLRQADPDKIVVMPCGFDIPKTREEMVYLEENPLWTELEAVKNKQVSLVDGNQYFNRPGPRLVESGEIFLEILHPEHFSFGHEGQGWEKY